MWGSRMYTKLMVSKPLSNSTKMLTQTAHKSFCFRWINKYREVFRPNDWNNPDRRSNDNYKMKGVQYRTQDPLFLDPKLWHIEGGIRTFITKIHDEGAYDVPLRNMAFVLYNAAKEGRRDPLLYKKFEENYGRLISDKIHPREAFGGVWA